MFKDFFNLNSPAFWNIIEKFTINLVFLFLLIRLVYYRYSKRVNYVFSLFLMGILIFILGSMLPIVFNTDMGKLGMAIGLFAIFTIIRFRTRNLSVKDMAYFFTIIAISAINSFKWVNFPALGVFILNIIIILSASILELLLVRKTPNHTKTPKVKKASKVKFSKHPIVYDNMEMLKPQNKEELIKNVAEITGLDVKKVRIRRVNYKEKVAELDVFYSD
jgi:hypothetical protein